MPDTTEPQLLTLAENVYAWIGPGGSSNSGVICTPQGLLVIDAQEHQGLARRFRETVEARTNRPTRTLINTHWHLDHISGNIVFGDVPILAHENAMKALETALGPRLDECWTIKDLSSKIKAFYGASILELVPNDDPIRAFFERRFGSADYNTIAVKPPTETFADRYTYNLHDDRLRLEHWGRAHSDCDIVIYLDKKKVIFLGDLYFHGRFPWLGDCDLDGWINILDRVLRLDVAVVVPGHGPPTGLMELQDFRELLSAIRSAVERAIKAGRSETAAIQEISLPQYAHLPRYQEWMRFNVASAYRYLRAG